MYLVQKNQLRRLTKPEYQLLRQLTHLAKNLYNMTLFTVRQYYFTYSSFLPYEQAYHLLKDNENYQRLPSQVAQQTMRLVHRSMRSFFCYNGYTRTGLIIAPVRFEYPTICQKTGISSVFFLKTCLKSNERLFASPSGGTLRKNSGPGICTTQFPHISGGSQSKKSASCPDIIGGSSRLNTSM